MTILEMLEDRHKEDQKKPSGNRNSNTILQPLESISHGKIPLHTDMRVACYIYPPLNKKHLTRVSEFRNTILCYFMFSGF